jgi:signal transduction histidine kinase
MEFAPLKGMDTARRAPHWIDMKVLCLEVLQTHADRAARHHVTIDLALPSGDAFVIGRRDLLRGALDRLMIRALRAMPTGGELALSLRRDPHVVVEVRDTGAFDTTTVTTAATSAVRAICEAHGGQLWRRWHRPTGSCFVVELPAAGPGAYVAA